MTRTTRWAAAALATLLSTSALAQHDLVINGGTIFDGSGAQPWVGWVAVDGDRIAAMGTGAPPAAARTVDATGKAVSPGFINMLSWAVDSLIIDGRGMSDVLQGVTLEVMGEGNSMGPLNPAMRADMIKSQADYHYPVDWTSLREYQDRLVAKGISPNIASFVGATTVRIYELGEDDVDPTPEQLTRMRKLVQTAMNEGALGVGSSLIYNPATFAETPELVALATESARCGGMYISHIRNEGDHVNEATAELITIAQQSGGSAEIYHMKQAGKRNWDKLPSVVAQIEAARAAGTRITADMYTYTAGATGLDASMPKWVQAGGLDKWIARLKDPAVRAKVAAEMDAPGVGWDNLYNLAGTPDNILLIGFNNPKLKPLTGKTLAEVAKMRGTSPEITAMDLVIEDGSRVGTAYFLMDEANVAKQTALPWMSFGSDEAAPAAEGVFLLSNSHPRAYGNVARLLGKYIRDQGTASLPDAVRRLTSLPATNLSLVGRGALKPGNFADIVVFDAGTIIDHATYKQPAQYATGVRDVFINGTQVVKDGSHTGAKPGRVVLGPGTGRCTG
jgi:N-acyl-D-amino-acid deacylase